MTRAYVAADALDYTRVLVHGNERGVDDTICVHPGVIDINHGTDLLSHARRTQNCCDSRQVKWATAALLIPIPLHIIFICPTQPRQSYCYR